jgi:hypothetical protein
MRQGAFVVEVVGRPTELTGPVVRALATVVTRIFAVAREAIGEGGQLAFAEYQPWRSAWLSHLASLETILAFAIFWTSVGGSLSGVKAGDDARWGRGRSLFQEVRVEVRVDRSMSKVPLHDVFLLLCLALNGVELNPLPLHVCETRILCA